MNSKLQLVERKCCKCDKGILVAQYMPNPDSDKATGMSLRSYDENGLDHFIGWICEECAQKLYDEKKAGYGCCGDDWECILS